MDSMGRMSASPSSRRLASLLISTVSAVVLVASSGGTARAAVKQFIALLNAGQEVPATDSAALGVAHLTYDTQTKMLCYSISYSDLESGQNDELQSHFHGPAAAGQNAPVLFAILQVGTPKSGCVGPLEKDQKKALLKGELYINVHTNQFPNGEIRGQVLPVKGV